MFSPILLRRIALAVLVAFGNLVAQPVVAAVNLPSAREARSESDEERHGRKLEDLGERLEHARHKHDRGEDDSAEIEGILNEGDALEAEEGTAEAGFAEVESHLRSHNLPPKILQRHQDAVAEYRTKRAEFKRRLDDLRAARHDPARRGQKLIDLADFMKAEQKHKRHTPSDPNKLPFRSPEGKVRPPIETEAGFRKELFRQQPVRLAANGSLSGITLPSTTLPMTPAEADLAQTEDVQLTPAIRAKAAELGNNPVKIHNWVRNTIEFIPSYGSIQGSDLTLQAKRGNAFDTASLEIALLRAAGIPARYVYGTIQLPADQVMNWVGGVTTPAAAQSLLGQGGIPNVALVSGGKVAAFKLEHVWVEAYVDYVPSRGAVNRQGDTWVPLDASVKQYTYTQGMDLKAQVPLDAQGLIDQIKQGATVNEQEGWVQNLNQTALQAQLTDYQNRVKTYIDQTKPDATVGDVLGSKTITQKSYPILMGTLPYQTVATGAKLQSLPENLKWKFRTALYTGGVDYFGDLTGTQLVALSQSTAALAGKKLTMSFVPATQADLDLVNSYLPQAHADGTPIQPSELPSTLPGYLIKLKAEIRVDGQLVSQGGTVTMGSDLTQATAYFNPGTQQWEEGEANHPVAGEYQAIGLDLQGVSSSQLTALKNKLEQVKTKLTQFQQNPNDPTPIQNLTKEDLSGDLLYSGILGYFASVDGSDQLSAQSNGSVVAYRLPSYGSVIGTAQPYYWFGIVRSVSFPGVTMDVDRVFMHVETKDADRAKKVAYVRQVGAAASAFEHAVPERLFADLTKPLDDPSQPQGVSAVKALAIAASQGQKIYTLNAENQTYHASIVAGLNTDAETKAEISNALAAGKEVMVHQAEFSTSGWTGMGYIVLDPDTGAGAYKISGGANGGYIVAQAGMALFALIQLVNALAFVGPLLGMTLVGAPVGAAVMLLVATITLVAALLADNPYAESALSSQLHTIVMLTVLGAFAFAMWPILFAFIYTALLLYVVDIIMSENVWTRYRPNTYRVEVA